jgi:hypothetical protein
VAPIMQQRQAGREALFGASTAYGSIDMAAVRACVAERQYLGTVRTDLVKLEPYCNNYCTVLYKASRSKTRHELRPTENGGRIMPSLESDH